MKIFYSKLKALVLIALVMLSFTAKAQNSSLKLKYLGTAGWEIFDGNVRVLIDPYISRVKLGTGPSISPNDKRKTVNRNDYFVSDTKTIDEVITKKIDFILVHHSHFDHLADVPYIAKKTGAKIIGTETTCNILRAYGIPNKQLYPVKGGEDYQFENFSVKVIPTIHSALNNKNYIDNRVYSTVPKAPLKVSEFVEGGSLMFLARFKNKDVLTMGSMNFVERELVGQKPDILLAGVNRSQLGLYKYNERLLAVTNYPKILIPTHWDNFRLPYGFSQQKGVDQKLKPFVEDMKKVSPETKVIIPKHLGTITISDTKEQILQNEQKEILAGLTGKNSIKKNKPINDRYSKKNRTIARNFLGDWIQKLKLNLEEHSYKIDITRKGETKNYEGENIYTVIPSTIESDEYIIIGAHFDSVRNSPGANDNATGCGLVYGVAKQIANLKNRTKNVLVVYFDQEELGLVGSQAFTKFIKEKKLNIHSVHTVDQMGWDNDKDRNIEIEIPTPFLKSIYQKYAKQLGISAFVTPEAGSDHRAFRSEGFNAVGITEEYRNKDTTPHYHKNTDTYETINFEYLSFSTSLVYKVIKELISK